MFSEQDYIDDAEEPQAIDVTDADCTWSGCLYERKAGGFDLFYDHASSDFPSLDVASITKLRLLCEEDGGICFIQRISDSSSEKELRKLAQTRLLEWVKSKVSAAPRKPKS